ncbi:MAG: insulinase family protein [Calditrichaceae bacterium]|nr:insulinase family protein [Calditrichaceae bacterium]MBN2708953.1 insulinase family protein [Calditrichaceae bacterium]
MSKKYGYAFMMIFLFMQIPFAQQISVLKDNISIHQLDNGLQVLLIENQALPMTGVNVVVKTGSAYETFANSGMSHMLEHLLFNGTVTRTQKELYDQVDEIGGYNNANTGEYFTNFMMVTPAEYIRQGMEIQADMLFNSTLPEENFKKEKGIVMEEIAASLVKPEEQMERNIQGVLYAGHALSLPVLGTYSAIEHMNRDQVYRFYKNNYTPNNMIMSVIGCFNKDEMLRLIHDIYGKYAPGEVLRPENPKMRIGFDKIPAVENNKNQIFHRFYDGENAHIQLFFKLPEDMLSSFFDLLNLYFESAIITLENELKNRFPEIVNSARANIRQNPVINYLELDLSLRNMNRISDMSDYAVQLMRQLTIQFSAETLNDEISRRKTEFLKNLEKPHMFGIYNAQRMAEGGIEEVLNSYQAESVMQSAARLSGFQITQPEYVVIHYPQAVDTAIAGKAGKVETMLYNESPDMPALIVRKNPSGSLLAIHYMITHKAPLESKYGKDAAKILHECIGLRLNSAENKKKSSRFGLTYVVNDNPAIPMDNIYLHADFGYLRAEGLAEETDQAVAFLNETLLNFMPTREEYEKALSAIVRSSPMMGMGNKAKDLFDKLVEENIYHATPFSQNTETPAFEKLVEFSREYWRPDNMIIAVVSPFDPIIVKEWYSGFRSEKNRREFYKRYDLHYKINEQPVVVEKQAGGEQSYLYWGFIKPIKEEDKPALHALSLVLADRIVFDIREKQGMAYRMTADIDIHGDYAAFAIDMGTRPANVDILLPQFPGLFTAKLIEDLTEDELRKSINMYLGRMMFRRLSSINQGYYLSHSLYFYDDMKYDEDSLDKLKNIRLEQVKAAAVKYLQPENPVKIVVR